MIFYAVMCSQAGDRSLARRATASEAVEVMEDAIARGWDVREITRNRRVIDELVLRNDAWREATTEQTPET